MADKVTAAAITVIVAGTVGVGAVAIRTQKPSKPTPVAASPAPVVPTGTDTVITPPPVRTKPVDKPHHNKPHHKPDHQTPGGQGETGTVPGETPESPAPTDPVPTPGSEVPPPPPPPAPAWTGTFTAPGGIQGTNLAVVSQRVTGPRDQRLFGEVVTGNLVDKAGQPVGTVYIDFGGSIGGSAGSLSSLWLWIDTPEGQYRYAAGGNLAAATQADDGSTTYTFSGRYSLSSIPELVETTLPHDGTISISLGFWNDGTLFATGVSMTES
jgi:hypothetical protein